MTFHFCDCLAVQPLHFLLCSALLTHGSLPLPLVLGEFRAWILYLYPVSCILFLSPLLVGLGFWLGERGAYPTPKKNSAKGWRPPMSVAGADFGTFGPSCNLSIQLVGINFKPLRASGASSR